MFYRLKMKYYSFKNFLKNIWLFRKTLYNTSWYTGDTALYLFVYDYVSMIKINKERYDRYENDAMYVEKMTRLLEISKVLKDDTFIEVAEEKLNLKYNYKDLEFKKIEGRDFYELINNLTVEEKNINYTIQQESQRLSKEYTKEFYEILSCENSGISRWWD